MERLTEHHINKTLGAYMVCSMACIDDDFDCDHCEKLAEMVARLAAYEDTGLEPEDIEALRDREQGLAELLVNISCGCAVSYTRLADLAQAEKDGRLVVLQDGVSVRGLQEEYCMHKRISDEQLPSPSYTTGLMDGFSNGIAYILDKILTREEAEAALKKREEADNEANGCGQIS